MIDSAKNEDYDTMSGQLMLSILGLGGHFFKLASKLGLRNGNHFAKCRPTFGTDPNLKCLWGGAKEPTGLANLLERRGAL